MNTSKVVIALTGVAAVASIAMAAGNSGSAGKPLTTAPTYGETSNPDSGTTMMDDHSASSLQHRDPTTVRKLGPRTSANIINDDSMNPHGDRGSGGTSNSNDTATGTH